MSKGTKKELKDMTEFELREYDVPWPKNVKELNKIIAQIVNREHDYGTCVYAMSIAATATFYYVSHKLGVTGAQARCADLNILNRMRRFKHGFRILNFDDLLYPNSLDKFDQSSGDDIIENAEWLKGEAIKLLKDHPDSHPNVIAHWKRLAALTPHIDIDATAQIAAREVDRVIDQKLGSHDLNVEVKRGQMTKLIVEVFRRHMGQPALKAKQ